MTQKSSAWHEQRETKIGDYGEELVRTFLENKGYICYKSVTDGAHLCDFFIFRHDEGLVAGEVKTKPSRKKYPDTGFDLKHYEGYKKLMDEHNIRVFIFFVDEEKGEIYGNYLHELDKEHIIPGCFKYPFEECTRYGQKIRYYPLKAMLPIRQLSIDEITTLRILRGSDKH